MGYTELIKKAKVDINLPYIVSLSPKIYIILINLIKDIICRNPMKCTTKNYIYKF